MDLHVSQTLEHAIVIGDGPRNLGAFTTDNCRTLDWDVKGGLDVEQRLIVRRCETFHVLAATGIASDDDNAGSQVSVTYSAAQGQVQLQIPATGTHAGLQMDFVTHVYMAPDAPHSLAGAAGGGAEAVLRGIFDFAQLEPVFEYALTRTPCRLVPGSAYSCPGANDGDRAQTMWRINCTSSDHRNEASAALTLMLRNAVDLHVARKQSPMGFAGGFEQAQLQAKQTLFADEPSVLQGYRDLLNTTVVARVVTSRINAAVALIIAAVAVVIYQLAQVRDQPSTAIALHCVSQHWHGSEQVQQQHAPSSIACSSDRADGVRHSKPPEHPILQGVQATHAQAGFAPSQHASRLQLAVPPEVQASRPPHVQEPPLL